MGNGVGNVNIMSDFVQFWYTANMITIHNPDFNIRKIAESGQCFRLNPNAGGGYTLIAFGRALRIFDSQDGCLLDCGELAYETIWRDYFDLGRDYAAIRAAVDPQDAFLRRACDHGRGIRMLRQEPWKCLSALLFRRERIFRRSKPASRRSARDMASRSITAGGRCLRSRPRSGWLRWTRRIFLPARWDTAQNMCSPRRGWLLRRARPWCDREFGGSGFVRRFTFCAGRGVKRSANCVMLFGYQRLSRFPRDVWINRMEEREYGGAFPLERYPDAAGVLQQYVFYYVREANRRKTTDKRLKIRKESIGAKKRT